MAQKVCGREYSLLGIGRPASVGSADYGRLIPASPPAWVWLMVLLLSLLFLSPVLAAAQDEAEVLFREGIKALDMKQWDQAARLMGEAVARRPEDGQKWRIYGMRYASYLPYYYRGLARYRQNNCEEALKDWNRSLEAGAIMRTDLRNDFLGQLLDCQKRVLSASKPPEPAPTGQQLVALGDIALRSSPPAGYFFSLGDQIGIVKKGDVVIAIDEKVIKTFLEEQRWLKVAVLAPKAGTTRAEGWVYAGEKGKQANFTPLAGTQ